MYSSVLVVFSFLLVCVLQEAGGPGAECEEAAGGSPYG